MSNVYKKVLEIVAKATPEECKVMILAIAKKHPSVVVRAWDEPSFEVFNAVKEANLVKGKVAAIKKHRELTGSSLFDAKNFVEDAFYP